MRITDYEQVTSLAANDVFLIDGDRGTKIINQADALKDTKTLKISKSNVTAESLPITVEDERITSDMYVSRYYLGNPEAMDSNLTVTTSDGSVTISGSFFPNISSSLYIYLEKFVGI